MTKHSILLLTTTSGDKNWAVGKMIDHITALTEVLEFIVGDEYPTEPDVEQTVCAVLEQINPPPAQTISGAHIESEVKL